MREHVPRKVILWMLLYLIFKNGGLKCPPAGPAQGQAQQAHGLGQPPWAGATNRPKFFFFFLNIRVSIIQIKTIRIKLKLWRKLQGPLVKFIQILGY